MIIHPIPPLYDKESKILILGSFPSVKSREEGFFYGHPQNRFWKVVASVFSEGVPQSIEEKKAFLAEIYAGSTVLRRNIYLDACSPFVTGTVGCATYPDDAEDYDTLFSPNLYSFRKNSSVKTAIHNISNIKK